MIIKDVQFVKSSAKIEQCPKDGIPEYAFIGRSNVGKSSLINMLTDRKKMAKTSSTPGKTQLINHFIINDSWYLVDLPGYGYAKTSKVNRAIFAEIISDYILNSKQLVNLFVLLDSRIAPQEIDLTFMENLGKSGIPFSIVYTKLDKLKKDEVKQNIARYQKTLLESWESLPPEFRTSSVSTEGRDEILSYIDSLNTPKT